MVYNNVLKLYNDGIINDEESDILSYVALFHDVGKPKTYKIIDGKISNPGHARLSYHIALEILQKYLEFDKLIQVLNLILFHGKPNWIFEKDDPEKEVIGLSLDCNLNLLYWFCYCDNLGRISKDKDDLIIKLDYFKEIAIKLNCYNNTYSFNSSISKYNYIVKNTHHYLDIPFNNTKSKVYILSGLPGTGKDTYIKRNFNNIPVISLDEIRKELKIKATDEQGKVIQKAKETAKEYLRKGLDFVWNATNTSKQMRSSLIQLFDTYDAYIKIIFIYKPLSTILIQNKQRVEIVPDDVIKK